MILLCSYTTLRSDGVRNENKVDLNEAHMKYTIDRGIWFYLVHAM